MITCVINIYIRVFTISSIADEDCRPRSPIVVVMFVFFAPENILRECAASGEFNPTSRLVLLADLKSKFLVLMTN